MHFQGIKYQRCLKNCSYLECSPWSSFLSFKVRVTHAHVSLRKDRNDNKCVKRVLYRWGSVGESAKRSDMAWLQKYLDVHVSMGGRGKTCKKCFDDVPQNESCRTIYRLDFWQPKVHSNYNIAWVLAQRVLIQPSMQKRNRKKHCSYSNNICFIESL